MKGNFFWLKAFTLILAVFLVTPNVWGQIKEFTYDKTPEEEKAGKKFGNNFFRQWAMSSLMDGMSIPLEFENGFDTEELRAFKEPLPRGVFIGLFTYIYEFRYNLWNYRDYLSISAATPLSASFAIPTNATGVLQGKIPLIFDANFFAHSTYNNINQSGFFIGGGAQLVLHQMLSSNSGSFVEGVFRTGVKYPGRGGLSYMSFELGYGGNQKYEGINGPESSIKSLSFRLALGKTLNY